MAFAILAIPTIAMAQDWSVVVNNGDIMPDSDRTFNSYNPPSINANELVAIRARSKGGQGQPVQGVYLRDMSLETSAFRVFDRTTQLPYPNNLETTFIEPPAIPRIDILGDTVASRGVHAPVWEYLLPDGSDTRVGTTGIYAYLGDLLLTGASNLGQAPDFEYLSVPGHPGVKFDVFPGAPAVVEDTIVFKGNYVVGTVGHTGVFYRDLEFDPMTGGDSPPVLIANNEVSEIPGTGGVLFGSTAPPSAALVPPQFEQSMAVFAGFDNEDDPTAGGIYLAAIGVTLPDLIPLVEIGSQVPGEGPGAVFNRLGEGVSFDGRFVAFWGAWGEDTRDLLLMCPEDGNADLIAYCLKLHPDGFATTVPVNQGIFVYDLVTDSTMTVAKTSPDGYTDFLYWNFSGRAPGTGGGDDDGELARWRSSAFVATSGRVDRTLEDPNYHAAFKARTTEYDAELDTYVDPVDGIYVQSGPGNRPVRTLVETGMDGTIFDAEAIDPLTLSPLPVTEMAIERDGFRGKSIAVTITMGTEEAGWAGVYMTRLLPIVLGDANGDGAFNNLDIASFVLALTNPVAYQAMFPDVDPNVVLDMNGDGVFDDSDIASFVAALTGN